MNKSDVVIGIVTALLLADQTEQTELEPELICEVPFKEPRPGFGVKGQCRGRGLFAASLNTRIAGLVRRGRDQDLEQACLLSEQYLACGFPTEGRMCNELARSVRFNGVSALNLECNIE